MISDDVRARLAANLAKLAEIAVDETDPDQWPSMETQQGRGDRLWYKKNAGATIHLIDSIDKLLDSHRRRGAVTLLPDEENEERKLVREYEQRAEQIIQAARDGRKSTH